MKNVKRHEHYYHWAYGEVEVVALWEDPGDSQRASVVSRASSSFEFVGAEALFDTPEECAADREMWESECRARDLERRGER